MAQKYKLSELTLTGLSANSREIKTGYLFAAIPGTQIDGTKFIPDAIKAGASAVLVNHEYDVSQLPDSVDFILDSNPRRRLAKLAAEFYTPQPTVNVAITGTNGKSSVADFTRQLWALLNIKSASIGTLGVVTHEGETSYGLTTPDPVDLHKSLHELQKKNINHVALEASSHGLDMYRLDGLSFDVAAFTNLSQDHLDYHGTMEIYRESKLRLFSDLLKKGGTAVVNSAAAEFDLLSNMANEHGYKILAYGLTNGEIRCVSKNITSKGYHLKLDVMGTHYAIDFPLPGIFQIENALCAAGILIANGHSPQTVIPLLAQLKPVRGRLEYAGHYHDASIFVDFAHTPDALKTVLQTLRPHVKNKLKVIFGCGGDRDRAKRPLMSQACLKYADQVILTDDNPRNEDPAQIRKDAKANYTDINEIPDRATAIHQTVQKLEAGDILVIAGKGHEQGQIINGKILHFDDVEEVEKAMATYGEDKKHDALN